jgi:long-chain acyl-CoA synthetase
MPSSRTLTARLFAALDRHADRPLLVVPGRDAADRVVTAGAVRDEATRLAMALAARGVRPGQPVLLWSENRERWLVSQLALLLLGAPAVPRGAEAPADEIAWIVDKVRARVALVERPELLRRLAATPHHVATAVLLSGTPPASDAGSPAEALSWEACLSILPPANGAGAPDPALAAWRASRLAEIEPSAIAAIVFTSGTTGRPKGVVLTHLNLAANVAQVLAIIDWLPVGSTSLSILPPWHMFEQMVEYAMVELGVQIVYSDRRHFSRDLARFRPVVLGAVPRLWLALEEGVRARLSAAPPRRRRLVEWALARAIARARVSRLGAEAPSGTAAPGRFSAPLDFLLHRLLLRKIARALGVDRLARGLPISGGGSLPEHVDSFFAALGVPLLNGYGLTETSPVLALRRPGHRRGGTVGPPVADTEIEIRDPETRAPLAPGRRGVIHARGPQVMQGYFEDPAATARVLAADGWFDTGDLGHLDAHGELAITGRAKDTIVLLSGENVEPEPIENALMASPRIAQVVVVGQDQRHLAALVVPRLEPGAPPPPPAELERTIRAEIDARIATDRGFRPNERIARFVVLDLPFTVESGLLSQTLKVKRAVVAERFAEQIARLFADRGAS